MIHPHPEHDNISLLSTASAGVTPVNPIRLHYYSGCNVAPFSPAPSCRQTIIVRGACMHGIDREQ